ncbi:hypothetical protein M438DRAFT_158701 [Aureobasidium pullulans EXF-150]|uniref:Uncharacterized protein n=1 Tax=Aureobasidium pullulans EXF-150 TaxID=1043002 RepID=A0A074XY64_AURPU|nr:uncharacterized protein M438DRAFT_158701 [Aureobasidium pullulans EXF-150]KEQ86902.1 hypothetical protein M438DRAFT_158701 [Aureobasidium pullulans EXF-150]
MMAFHQPRTRVRHQVFVSLGMMALDRDCGQPSKLLLHLFACDWSVSSKRLFEKHPRILSVRISLISAVNPSMGSSFFSISRDSWRSRSSSGMIQLVSWTPDACYDSPSLVESTLSWILLSFRSESFFSRLCQETTTQCVVGGRSCSLHRSLSESHQFRRDLLLRLQWVPPPRCEKT